MSTSKPWKPNPPAKEQLESQSPNQRLSPSHRVTTRWMKRIRLARSLSQGLRREGAGYRRSISHLRMREALGIKKWTRLIPTRVVCLQSPRNHVNPLRSSRNLNPPNESRPPPVVVRWTCSERSIKVNKICKPMVFN